MTPISPQHASALRTIIPRCLAALLPPIDPVGHAALIANPWQPDSAANYCRRCGSSVGPGEATDTGCAHCRDRSVSWNRVYRLGAYHPPLRDWIIAMKFRRAWAWAPWFGRAMAGMIENQTGHPQSAGQAAATPATGPPAPDVVVPIPLHFRRRATRGFDQSHLIAEALASRRNWPLERALKRVRHTDRQSDLPRSRRAENVQRAFALRTPLPMSERKGEAPATRLLARFMRSTNSRNPHPVTGRTVWLVDDVLTSGATAAQCARLLKSAGAARVNVVVVAVTDARQPDAKPDHQPA